MQVFRPRQVVFPAARVIEDRLVHQRQPDEHRQLVAHDRLHADHRIKAAHQRHPATDREVAEQQHMAGAVEQRKLPGDAVVAAEVHLDAVAHDRHHHGEVAMHRALRPRGGAGRVDDHRQVAVVDLDLGLDLGLALYQLVEILEACAAAVPVRSTAIRSTPRFCSAARRSACACRLSSISAKRTSA